MPKPPYLRFGRENIRAFADSMSSVLTIDEVAHLCATSRTGVMYHILRGTIYAQKRGKTWLVSRASLKGVLNIVNEEIPQVDNFPVFWEGKVDE